MTDSLGNLRQLCIALAREAGELALEGRSRDLAEAPGHPPAEAKSSATDLVTQHDRAAEAHIRRRLNEIRPGDGLLGEEGSDITGTTGLRWIVDPIDGTTNFVYGAHAWGPSIAVEVNGKVVAGAVHIPSNGETFHAAYGFGAALNDQQLQVNRIDEVATALIATGFSYDPDSRREQGRRVAALLPKVRDIRRSGSAAVDLCSVACGRVDAYYESHLNEWDVAAGLLIAREAGALASSFDGGSPTPDALVVCAPGIHRALLELLA